MSVLSGFLAKLIIDFHGANLVQNGFNEKKKNYLYLNVPKAVI